ncbi:MAG: MBL fold metallo-hydrolase [Acutalibacteraceae bacterium]
MMKAEILADNIAKAPYQSEWGLCVYIEYGSKGILLDTGAGSVFLTNAEKAGIDLSQVDFGVLSHAHYDHADGLAAFFQTNGRAKFYLSRHCAEDCYGKHWIFSKYIGIKKGTLQQYAERIEYVDSDCQLCPGVHLIAHHTQGLDRIGRKAGMYRRTKGQWTPDSFAHEQSLVLETEKGLVIFNSCCHGGVDNIISEVKYAFPGQKIHAVIGGFHLYTAPQKQILALADKLRQSDVEKIYTGHCTGKRAFRLLQSELGDRVEQLHVGMVIRA